MKQDKNRMYGITEKEKSHSPFISYLHPIPHKKLKKSIQW